MDFGPFLFVIAPVAVAVVVGITLQLLWPQPVAAERSDEKKSKRTKHEDVVDASTKGKGVISRAQARKAERPDEDEPVRRPVADNEPVFEMPTDFRLAEYSGRAAD